MANPFTFDTDAEAILALEAEGRRLKYIALKMWRKDMSGYKPKMYVRTRKSQNSVKLGSVKRLDAFTWGIELFFESGLAYHDSVFDKGKKGHSIMLISEGWKVRSGWHKKIKRFGYFEGTDYISRVIREFNNGARMGITLEVNWNGEKFKKRKNQPNVLK